MKGIQWNLISLDGLLDFILTESKLVLSYSEIQSVVISEFQRRFKEEFLNTNEEVGKTVVIHKKSSDFNSNLNIASSQNNTRIMVIK